MIDLTRITSSESEEYRFTEELLTASFPVDEYRDQLMQRNNCDTNHRFYLMIAHNETSPVGFISYWELEDFYYVEHLATLPAVRNKGYGKEIIRKLQSTAKSIVLEVEMPTDELTLRRIEFYKRMGFKIADAEYTQPAYRPGGNELPMKLMFWGETDTEKYFEHVKKSIYRHVYNKVEKN